jgi:hypothetical protein
MCLLQKYYYLILLLANLCGLENGVSSCGRHICLDQHCVSAVWISYCSAVEQPSAKQDG